ncbi:MAG: HEAT repeat domain-containing protein [Calditrichaceae bacterium]
MSIIDKNNLENKVEDIIRENIHKLADNDGLVRETARNLLISIGSPAIDYLFEMISHPDVIARWEALKILIEIKDPNIIPLLINALDDNSSGIRWLAAEGLAALGKEAFLAMLTALSAYPDTVSLRKGVKLVMMKHIAACKDPNIVELVQFLDEPDAAFRLPVLLIPFLERESEINRYRESQ